MWSRLWLRKDSQPTEIYLPRWARQNIMDFLLKSWRQLTPSDFRTDKSVRKRRPAVTFVRIYPYTDFAIEIWGFYRRLTDTLRYHYTRCSRASGLGHPLVSMFTKSEEKWSLLGVVRCLWRVLENYDCRTKFNSSLGMEYNGGLYAVKVKLVDSLIWRPFILSWIRPWERWQARFDTCKFLFWTIRSLNFRTFIDALCNNCY